MTINITVFGDDYLLQAADRCVSVNGNPVAQLNKVVVFASDRLRLGVTYTGLAADGNQWPTDMWICETLCNNSYTNASGEQIAEEFRVASNKRLEALPPDWRTVPTIYTFAGWDMANEVGRVFFQVHNCLDELGLAGPPGDSFQTRYVEAGQRVLFSGALRPDVRSDRRLLDRMLRLARSRTKIAEEVVAIVRHTAAYTRVVGPDPITVVLPLGGDAVCEYNPPGRTPWTFGSGLVICSSTQGVMTIGSPEAFYGSPELEAEVGGFTIGDAKAGFGVTVRKKQAVKAD